MKKVMVSVLCRLLLGTWLCGCAGTKSETNKKHEKEFQDDMRREL